MTRRTSTLNALFAVAVLGTVGMGQAPASENDELCAAIAAEAQSSGGNVCVVVNDGVATLSGYVESPMERRAAERAALDNPAVERVINLITTSD